MPSGIVLIAAALRIRPDFAALCQPKLLIFLWIQWVI